MGILDAGEILDNPRNDSTQQDSYRDHAPTILVNSVLGNHSMSGKRRATSNILNSKSYNVKELDSEDTPDKNKTPAFKLALKSKPVSSRISSFVNIEDSRVRGERLDNSQSSRRLTQSPLVGPRVSRELRRSLSNMDDDFLIEDRSETILGSPQLSRCLQNDNAPRDSHDPENLDGLDKPQTEVSMRMNGDQDQDKSGDIVDD
jgi:hypothetical protein